MQKIDANVSFVCPCSIYIVGPTMSGKSTLTRQLLNNMKLLFEPAPTRVVYAYGVHQESFDKFDTSVQLVHGIESILSDDDFFDKNIPTLLVIDDLMDEISSNKLAISLFTRNVHHKNVTVIFLSQNLFKQGKNMRDIALNSQYLILFKSVRDIQQVKVLARQTGIKHLEEAYQKAIKQPFGYLLVNLRPESPDILRLQSHITEYRRIYVRE